MHQFSEESEYEALKELKNGGQAAFSSFYHKYRLQLYANLFKLVKSHELATDLLQEVFVKLWQKRDQIDLEKDFRAYLFTIAQRTAYDFFRATARRRALHEGLLYTTGMYMESNPVEEGIQYAETLELLNHYIAQLPPQCQKVFRLCKLEGRSYEEVALQLGISTATVNNHIVKATRILKKHFCYHYLPLSLATLVGLG